ncbi:hypothetical protein HK104_006670 [Borealophlyctis nickersoniae]|nr:hypothetical protein HK104_006670 [Borealophlyctis nickersoniae]
MSTPSLHTQISTILATFTSSPTAFGNDIINAIRLVSAEEGKLVLEWDVKEGDAVLNHVGSVHGAVYAFLVDNLTSLALFSLPNAHTMSPPGGVSSTINMTYIAAAKPGDTLVILAEAVKLGRSLAVTECTITRKNGNAVLAKGTHVKFVGAKL